MISTKPKNPPILFKDIQQGCWDKATQRAQKSSAAIVIVHPNVLDDAYKSHLSVLLSQTHAPVIVLCEAHDLIDTQNWLLANECLEHVLVPTIPGWPYPFLSREEYNHNLSDYDLAVSLQKRAYRPPTSFGDLETSYSTPSNSAADFGHKQLAQKLISIGVENVYIAGGSYSGYGLGCAGILLFDFAQHFGSGCKSTTLVYPRAPECALSAAEVLDELTSLVGRHNQ